MKKQFGLTRFEILAVIIVCCAIVIGVAAVVLLDTTGKSGSGLGKEFLYDVEDLVKIDPNLITYKESEKKIDTGFTQALAITIDSEGNLYVTGDKSIRKLSQNGEVLKEIQIGGESRCIAVSSDGRIYAGIKDHIEVYDNDGKQIESWESLGKNAILTSIAVNGSDVFAADAGNRIVIRYNKEGRIINHIGKKDKQRNIPGFVIPSPYFDLAVGKDGLLRVVNPGTHRIEAYTFDGDLEFWWGKSSAAVDGFSGCCNPINFAILEDESFVTCEKGLMRVKIYDAEGTFTSVVAGPEQLNKKKGSKICYLPAECQAGGFDIAVDSDGTIFVLDTIKNTVRIFTKKDL